MRSRVALTTAVAMFAAAAPSAVARPADFRTGQIIVGEGAHGATLGMTRAQLIDTLGKPDYENNNGYMDFVPVDDGIFDFYRGQKSGRVNQISISFPGNGGWTLDDGNKIFKRGGIQRLYKTYGSRVHEHYVRQDGTKYFVIRSHYKGRTVRTSFAVATFDRAKAKVLQIFIGLKAA